MRCASVWIPLVLVLAGCGGKVASDLGTEAPGDAATDAVAFDGGAGCDMISTAKACPNDTALTPEQVTAAKKACNDELAGTCGSQYKAIFDCVAANPGTCGADGKSVATTKCDAQVNAYIKCKTPAVETCGACTTANCATEFSTCEAETTCKKGIDCLNACPTPDPGNTCHNKCISDNPDPSGSTKFTDLVTCLNYKCKIPCFPG